MCPWQKDQSYWFWRSEYRGLGHNTCIGTYAVSKNNRRGISWQYTEYKLKANYCSVNRYSTISYASSECLCLNWNFIVYDVQNATYSSHRAPCPARDLFPWLNTRVKVHISIWTIHEYPKGHSSYLSDSGGYLLTIAIDASGNNLVNTIVIKLFSAFWSCLAQIFSQEEKLKPIDFGGQRSRSQ